MISIYGEVLAVISLRIIFYWYKHRKLPWCSGSMPALGDSILECRRSGVQISLGAHLFAAFAFLFARALTVNWAECFDIIVILPRLPGCILFITPTTPTNHYDPISSTMPKVISRAAISSSDQAPETASSKAVLRTFYCLCGEFMLVIDRGLDKLPRRR